MKKKMIIAVLTATIMLICATAMAAPSDKTLKVGMRGVEVEALQQSLIKAGVYDGVVDGVFSDNTLKAVYNFQRDNGLVADGIVGRMTWSYLERSMETPSRYSRKLMMSASAYSAFDPGNNSTTCRGNYVAKGLVAVDPNVIPLGTRMFISGYGPAIADDIGGGIKGNRIDLAFDSHREALDFGRQQVVVYIID